MTDTHAPDPDAPEDWEDPEEPEGSDVMPEPGEYGNPSSVS